MITEITFCAGLASLLLFVGRRVLKRVKRKQVYGRRPELSMAAIWQAQFAADGLDPAQCEASWMRLSRTYGVRPGKLRASDRFDGELRHLDHLFDGWLLRLIASADDATLQFRPERVQTVRDFVLCSARRAQRAGLPGLPG